MSGLHLHVSAVVLLAALCHSHPAQALTICASDCGNPGESTPFDAVDWDDLAVPGIYGLILTADDHGITLNAMGDLVVHVPLGTIVSASFDLRSAGSIFVDDVSITASGNISLCTFPALSNCLPFETAVPDFTSDPFHLAVLGQLDGPLELYAAGNILITTMPIPEPGAGVLIALGLVGLVRNRRRVPTR